MASGTALLLCAAILLCGCTELKFETDEYRRMNDMYMASLNGETVTKDSLYHKFGYPDAYVTEGGEKLFLSYGERENMQDALFQPRISRWIYYCKKYEDYENELELIVTFDLDGTSTAVSLL